MTIQNKEKEKYQKTPFMKALQAGTGLGIVRGNIVPIKGAILGEAKLWHGTPLKNMFPNEKSKGIFQEGVTTRFAGANKRLNNLLMQNSFMRETEDFFKKNKIKITPEIEGKLYDITKDMLGKYKTSKAQSLPSFILYSAKDIAEKMGLDKSKFKDYIKAKLPEFGKRSYFGAHPSSVAFWGKEGKNEINFFMDKQKEIQATNALKQNIRAVSESFANQITGGLYQDIKEKISYGKGKKTNVKTLEDAKKILEDYKKAGKDFNVSFRANIPTRSMQHMKDFPGFRHIVGSSPGLKTFLANYIPSSDPSKDLSIIEKVKPKYIDRFHVIDPESGKLLEEIRIKKAERPGFALFGGKGHRWKNIKKSLIPLALTAFGGEMVYNALTDKTLFDIFKKKKFLEKKGYLDPIKGVKAFAYPAAFLGASGAVSMGLNKALNVKLDEPLTKKEFETLPGSEKIKYQAREFNYLKKATPIATLSGTAMGAATGAMVSKPNRAIGAMVGGFLAGQIARAFASEIPQIAKRIKLDPAHSGFILGPLSKINKKVKQVIQDNPEAAAIGQNMAIVSSAAGLPYVAAKKYYPYHAKVIGQQIDSVKEYLKGPETQNFIKTYIKPRQKRLIAATLVPVVLPYLIYQTLESATKGAGSFAKKMEEKKKYGK